MEFSSLRVLMLFIAIMVHQGCTMVKITISEKRNPIPQHVTIGEKTTLTTWGPIKVNKVHFFPSSFRLKADDTVIYIDPVEVDSAEPADYILITHAHPDHFSLKDIQNLLKEKTTIICSRGASKKMKDVNNEIHIVKPNQQLEFEGLHIETTFAYNRKSVFLWIKAHPKSKENVGYVITLKNGLKIYHAGDTDYIPEMKNLSNIDAALVPIGGDNLTMNAEEAARIVNEIRPTIVIPMHYEIKNLDELNQFDVLVNAQTSVIKLNHEY